MNVNSAFRVSGNRFALLCGILVFIVAVFFIASAFTKPSTNDLFVKRMNLVIREIGHHLLLQAGDSTSRVLPVRETSAGVFFLEFENEFGFEPDSLIALTQRSLAKTDLTDYTVTVYECLKTNIVYGFQVSPPANLTEACRGRRQPKACYTIEIAFANFNNATNNNTSASVIISGFLLLVSVVLIFKRFEKNTTVPANDINQPSSVNSIKTGLPAVGKFIFDLHNQRLLLGNEVIVLTEKECKILELLNKNFGELTSREALTQEVWANEGVITGRSLDMFVSKLRKKLSVDPDLRITNIHGRGYKLEVVTDLTG